MLSISKLDVYSHTVRLNTLLKGEYAYDPFEGKQGALRDSPSYLQNAPPQGIIMICWMFWA